MPVCYISLGGNLGAVEQTFDRAIETLRREGQVQVTRISSQYRTAAVGEQSGGEFLNAVAELSTELAPLELLQHLQKIETQQGRTREVVWGPRTLDLDLLFYGQEQILTRTLLVPHPHCWYRRFVLDPLAEIAPNFVHPVLGKSIAEIRAILLQRPFLVGLAANTEAEIQQLEQIVREFPEVEPVKNKVPVLHSAVFRDTIFKIILENGTAGIISPRLFGAKVFNRHQAPVETFLRNTLRAALGT